MVIGPVPAGDPCNLSRAGLEFSLSSAPTFLG